MQLILIILYEATFSVVFNDLKDEFCGTWALQGKLKPVDYTFKVEKSIQGHG